MVEFAKTSVAVRTGEDLLDAHLVYDGDGSRKTNHGNFIGVFGSLRLGGTRPGFVWFAENGDQGECRTASEAEAEIRASWYGDPARDEGSFNPK